MRRQLHVSREKCHDVNVAAEEGLRPIADLDRHVVARDVGEIDGDLIVPKDTPSQRSKPKHHGRQREYADTLHTGSKALLALINNILDFAKLDANQVDLEARFFALSRCVADSVALSAKKAEEKGLLLDYAVEGPPVELVGDVARLRQVLVNLISNAVKFTGQGSVRVQACVQVLEASATVDIFVRDTGIGIADDKRDHLFEKFSQADATTTRRFGGTGLGLAICKRIIVAMGGTIELRGEVGEGTTARVSLTLPLAEHAAKHDSDEHVSLGAEISKLAVLVAEDNHVNQLVIRRLLQRLGCDPVIVDDGAAALEAARLARFDVIFMDMQMPVLDGLDATRAIRALSLNHQPRIIALTANAQLSDRRRCAEAGMDDFLAKPVNRRAVAQALNLALLPEGENRGAHDEAQSSPPIAMR